MSKDIYLDTSIEIAKLVHPRAIREEIKGHLSSYDHVVTGKYVQAEFLNNIVKEAIFLLKNSRQVKNYNQLQISIRKLRSHPGWNRKYNLCFDLLTSIVDKNGGDNYMLEMITAELERFIIRSKKIFERTHSRIQEDVGCLRSELEVKRTYKNNQHEYSMDTIKCHDKKCNIFDFLKKNETHLAELLTFLTQLETKTKEIDLAIDFIKLYFKNDSALYQKNRCAKVGDLLIALSSKEVSNFYSMNYKESRHFAKHLMQNFIFRPHQEEKSTIVCHHDQDWDDLLPKPNTKS